MRKLILPALLLICVGEPATAEEYDNSVSLGAYIYAFSSSSKDLAGLDTPPGIRASEQNTDTLALVYTRMLTPDWSLSLAIGAPPTYRLVGKNVAAPLGSLVDLRALSPAFIVQHHWQFEEGKLEPFVGLGINYNHFYHFRPSDALNTALGGSTDISVSDVWSPVVSVGTNLNITDRTFVTFAASYVGMAANAQLTTGPITRSLSLQLNPIVYRLTVGYRF